MGSSEPAHLSSSCSTSGSAATVNNEESKKTVTTETTAQRVPSLCAVRSRSRRSQCIHRRSVLCSTWVKNTEDSNCSQKALGNCVVSTVQPASYVALSDRNDATDAALATAIPPLRELRAGDTFQGRRQPGHQNAAPSGAAADQQPPQSSQPVPPGDPLEDSPLPNCTIRDIVFTERDKQLLTELRRASAMALPYRCRLLLAEIPKGLDRNSELKLRLHLWETGQICDLICKVLGQQHSGPLRRTARRVQPQTDEQGGKRACALQPEDASAKP